LLGLLIEFFRGHGGAMDAIAAGFRAHIDDWVAGARCRRIEDAVRADEACAHGVDEDVTVVALVEIRLAADGRDTHAITVVAYAGNHARDEVACLGVS